MPYYYCVWRGQVESYVKNSAQDHRLMQIELDNRAGSYILCHVPMSIRSRCHDEQGIRLYEQMEINILYASKYFYYWMACTTPSLDPRADRGMEFLAHGSLPTLMIVNGDLTCQQVIPFGAALSINETTLCIAPLYTQKGVKPDAKLAPSMIASVDKLLLSKCRMV